MSPPLGQGALPALPQLGWSKGPSSDLQCPFRREKAKLEEEGGPHISKGSPWKAILNVPPVLYGHF